MSKDGKSIINVKKIKKQGHGHHGGAWKVGFADFMTAMMAFFMVMWIIGMSDEVKVAVEGYFQNPVGFESAYGSSINPLTAGTATAQGSGLLPLQLVARQIEEQRYREIAVLGHDDLDLRGDLAQARAFASSSSRGTTGRPSSPSELPR